MRTSIVFTLTGTDRVGIVEEVTEVLLGHGGNIEASRMARLGGEFAMLALVTLPGEELPALSSAFSNLESKGYRVTVCETQTAEPATASGWRMFRINVQGADHEGIIHEIAAGLSRTGVNIESMETGTTAAPMSGTLLFTMDAVVAVPPQLTEAEWQTAIVAAARQSSVEIEVSAADS